jgi:hypothetical protein
MFSPVNDTDRYSDIILLLCWWLHSLFIVGIHFGILLHDDILTFVFWYSGIHWTLILLLCPYIHCSPLLMRLSAFLFFILLLMWYCWWHLMTVLLTFHSVTVDVGMKKPLSLLANISDILFITVFSEAIQYSDSLFIYLKCTICLWRGSLFYSISGSKWSDEMTWRLFLAAEEMAMSVCVCGWPASGHVSTLLAWRGIKWLA